MRLKKEDHIDIFNYLCDFNIFISRGGLIFNLNQNVLKNLLYLFVITIYSLITSPVVDSTIFFYTVLKWLYEKKIYRLNESYYLFFKMLLLSLFFGVTQRLLYVFRLFQLIFSEYPFYKYMRCIMSRKNLSIFNTANKKIYFNKVNPFKLLSIIKAVVQKSTLAESSEAKLSKLLGYLKRNSEMPPELAGCDHNFEYLFFSESCAPNVYHMGVDLRVRTYCGVLPLGSYIFRTTPGKHGELHSNVVDIHELEGKNGPYIKPQIMAGTYMPFSHQNHSAEANAVGVKCSQRVSQYGLTYLGFLNQGNFMWNMHFKCMNIHSLQQSPLLCKNKYCWCVW